MAIAGGSRTSGKTKDTLWIFVAYNIRRVLSCYKSIIIIPHKKGIALQGSFRELYLALNAVCLSWKHRGLWQFLWHVLGGCSYVFAWVSVTSQVGTGLWGICTIQLAMTSNFALMIVLRVRKPRPVALTLVHFGSFWYHDIHNVSIDHSSSWNAWKKRDEIKAFPFFL